MHIGRTLRCVESYEGSMVGFVGFASQDHSVEIPEAPRLVLCLLDPPMVLFIGSWESKGTPPRPPPPRNKALIRPY